MPGKLIAFYVIVLTGILQWLIRFSLCFHAFKCFCLRCLVSVPIVATVHLQCLVRLLLRFCCIGFEFTVLGEIILVFLLFRL